MAITAERFAHGMTYDEYKAQMTRNQDRFAANEAAVQLQQDDVTALVELPEQVNVLVLAEDWCGDVINNLPVLGRLATASEGKLKIRIFLRDQNLDLMNQYLNHGEFQSIPVFAFFDQQFKELGHFIERPAQVTKRRERLMAELYAQHPEFGPRDQPVSQLPEAVRGQVIGAMMSWREQSVNEDNQAVITEIRTIATGK